LNLEKDLSPQQLVTIKLRNKGSSGWIDQEPLILGISPKRAFVIFLLLLRQLALDASRGGASPQKIRETRAWRTCLTINRR